MARRTGNQTHHNVPLSIGGRDVRANKVSLKTEDHKHIHNTLDVPYNTVRRYRGVMNENMFTPTKKQARAQKRIESLFFARAKFLTPRLGKIVLDKLREDTRDMYKQHEQEYPTHKPTGNLQGEVDAEIEKRGNLYMYLVGGVVLALAVLIMF